MTDATVSSTAPLPQAPFPDYEHYIGEPLYRDGAQIGLFGLLLIPAFAAIDAWLLGLGTFVRMAPAYGAGMAFVGLMLVAMRWPWFERQRPAWVLTFGNLGMVAMLSTVLHPVARPERIPHVLLFFMFGVILLAPVLTVRLLVWMHVMALALLVAVALLWWDSSAVLLDPRVLTLLPTLSVPALAFLAAIVRIQRRSAHEQYQLARRTYTFSTIDALSKLLNRREWMARAERWWRRSTRDQASTSLILLDLDHFKRINDQWGHSVGDRVIEAVGACLLQATRDSDLAGRLGGEEFAILLPRTELAEALGIAERIRLALAGQAVDTPQGETVHFTASLGVAQARDGSLKTLLDAADRCLYAAKDAGRNRCHAQPSSG